MYRSPFIVFDCETGGLISKAGIPPITEIGAVILNSELTEVGEFSAIVQPYVGPENYKKEAFEASNMSMEMIIREGKPSKVVLTEFINFLKKNKGEKKFILVGHNCDEFDIPILDEFFRVHGEDLSKYIESKTSVDTMWWGRMAMPEIVNHKLGTCLEAKKIDITQAHRALNDAKATKELFKKFILPLRGFYEGDINPVTSHRNTFKFQM